MFWNTNKDRLYVAVYSSVNELGEAKLRWAFQIGPKFEGDSAVRGSKFFCPVGIRAVVRQEIRDIRTDVEATEPVVSNLHEVQPPVEMFVRLRIAKITSVERLLRLLQNLPDGNFDPGFYKPSSCWIENALKEIQNGSCVGSKSVLDWKKILKVAQDNAGSEDNSLPKYDSVVDRRKKSNKPMAKPVIDLLAGEDSLPQAAGSSMPGEHRAKMAL